MTAIDAATLRRHIGTRGAVEEDVATEAPLKAIVATFDLEERASRQSLRRLAPTMRIPAIAPPPMAWTFTLPIL